MSQTYACCKSFDYKSNENFDDGKILRIRLRKFFQVLFSQNEFPMRSF